jgi:DNA-directed RNA polymerase subunit beta'
LLDVNYFDELRIGLATGDQIRAWSNGEVKKPETINYRTLKPEKDGLFCEKIFGPTKDWECYCGKYKRVRFKGIICERCGVEVTRAKVRRERMGHIELAAPVTHIWYFKGVPSRLGYLLDLAPKELEKVIYFAASIVTWVDEDRRHNDLPKLEADVQREIQLINERRDQRIEEILGELETRLTEMEARKARSSEKTTAKNQAERQQKEVRERAEREILRVQDAFDLLRDLKVKEIVDNEELWRELKDRYEDYFKGGMGAEAIKELLTNLDLHAEAEFLRDQIRNGKGQKRQRAIKRLKVVAPFTGETKNSPLGMVLDCVPVIPPDLRPMVQLDGGRFATSDLNDLYRRVINRNNRLKRLLDLGAPEIIVNNEKRMLQEAVDALFDNGRRGRPVTGPGNRPLKSLSDMLKGKQGRFRQNLLGKRVDYSGRSVIVAGPKLKLHQCGLPKQMALELFKPFVMKRLVDMGHAQNIKSAKRMVERSRAHVWDVLEEIIHEHPVLLNRAPTLHRLGIQAFEPVLVEGKAIQIHPLVCVAFNADFDGDQMAVHVPLSSEAQAEARLLMLSAHNVLSPAHGDPIVAPTQDIVIGSYYLTLAHDGEPGEGRAFSNADELIKAYDANVVGIHAKVKVRGLKRFEGETEEEFNAPGRLMETTVGRVLFNEGFPDDFPYVNSPVKKKELAALMDRCAQTYDKKELAEILDAVKNTGFRYATKSGVTVGLLDVTTPDAKPKILAEHEKRAEKVETQYKRGVITEDERRQELIEIWTEATEQVKDEMEKSFSELNPIYMMANSGARGNITQIRQLAGMRGLVTNPRGEIIPRPIRANFREGLSVLEYFISTHGARKGLADTALRTADSGYLTRRLVDVAQELMVRAEDCGTDRGIKIEVQKDRNVIKQKLLARVLMEDAVDPKGKTVVEAGTAVYPPVLTQIVDAGVELVTVRSVLTCEAKYGVCQQCYGVSLATGDMVEMGEAVGIVAAQSIGEPGTQLTMRTFHTGGVHGADDITQGLPRVVELFEARTPKGKAEIAAASGRLEITEDERTRTIELIPDDGSEPVAYKVPRRSRLRYRNGDEVPAGEAITEGHKDPDEILEILGIREVQLYLVNEVQGVYRSQGVSVHDKHIELIVRQMLRKVTVIEPGDSEFLPGELVDARTFAQTNEKIVGDGGEAATARPILMGITKASLATESWLSAASFQETTRVLTEAAIKGKSDPLIGLKENVIIGKLIPAGTGMARYRNIRVQTSMDNVSDEDARAMLGLGPRVEESYEDDAAALLGVGSSGLQAVPDADEVDLETTPEEAQAEEAVTVEASGE